MMKASDTDYGQIRQSAILGQCGQFVSENNVFLKITGHTEHTDKQFLGI